MAEGATDGILGTRSKVKRKGPQTKKVDDTRKDDQVRRLFFLLQDHINLIYPDSALSFGYRKGRVDMVCLYPSMQST